MTADSEHIEVLRRGPRSWNAWRAENPSIVPNLVGLALSIGDRQMGPINGGPINLAHARLRHAFLRFATLTRANLVGADLADTDLREARLEGANLSGADLSDADLAGADLADANLASANLCGADLSGVRNVTIEQLHAAEGDTTTVLPASVDLPLIWTVGQSEDAKPAAAMPAPRRKILVDEVAPAPTFEQPGSVSARVQLEPTPAPVDTAPRRRAPIRAREPEPPIVRPPLRGEEPRAEEPSEASRHVTWLVGGPRGVGRPRQDEPSASESGS